MSTSSQGRALTWVVGAGGLLGQHVVRALAGRHDLFAAPKIPWEDPELAADELRNGARRLITTAGTGRWQVIWCAGAGVTGTAAEAFETERAMLRAVLEGLGSAADAGGEGGLFLASSAGAVYAGSSRSPFDESSPTRPLAAYGRAKLEAETLVREWATATRTPLLVGRIANLYGPGQNLLKPQGLVSQLCAAHLERRPLSIWVSLDTLRDYIFAPDCAAMVVDAMDRLAAAASGSTMAPSVTKIFATQRAITIGGVLGELGRIYRRRPSVVLGASPSASAQSRDLSLRSRVWPELDHRTLTTFPAGVAATLQDLRSRQQSGI